MPLPTQDSERSGLDANGSAHIAIPPPRGATGEHGTGRRTTWLVLLSVWAISVGYTASVLRYGWIARDEGLLAHSAERVLEGEAPHKDFQDAYVGLLSYLHAFAFARMGTNLASLRLVLLFFFALFVPAVYWIASRMASRRAAAATTLIAVAWSVPNYTAAMPSWYNLFFTTFGLAALLYYLEAGSWWLLVLSGLSAGISCLFKITGLYFVAAILLFFIWRSPLPSGTANRQAAANAERTSVTLGVLFFLGSVVLLLRSRLGPPEIYHFLLPQLAIAGVLLRREWRPGARGGQSQLFHLARTSAPFLLGFLLPLAAFATVYANLGALRDLWSGVFLLPTKRLALAARSPAPLVSLAPLALVLLFVFASTRMPPSKRRGCDVVLSLGLLALLIRSARSASAFNFAWFMFAALIPAIVLLACWTLDRSLGDSRRHQALMLLTSTLATCSLVQYPFSTAAYFCYVAPLVALVALALLVEKPLPRPTLWVIFGFALLFPVVRLRPFMERDGFNQVPLVRLELARAGGLDVPVDQAREYQRLARLIEEHAPSGAYIYVAPDDPQVYFLTGTRNPTRILYSLFDEPQGQTRRILESLRAHHVHLVVIDTEPTLYRQIPTDLLPEIHSQFPYGASAGQFEVRWQP